MRYGLVETEKLYFSSSEAAEQIGVPIDILHAWEKEFKELKPKKNRAGKRIYRQSDIDIAKKLKEKESLAEQNIAIRKTKKLIPSKEPTANKESLSSLRDNLQSALNRLRIKRN